MTQPPYGPSQGEEPAGDTPQPYPGSPAPYEPGPGYPPASPYPGQGPAQGPAEGQTQAQGPAQVQPSYPQPPYPAPAPAQPPVYGSPVPAAPAMAYPKNDLAVWSLVLGIAGIVLSCNIITGIPAIIVGNLARQAVRKGEANNDGMAVAGVILGWVSVALAAIAVVLFVIWLVVFGAAVGFEELRDLSAGVVPAGPVA
jgi:hypothetical protein